mgnify:CR=1 FL=1
MEINEVIAKNLIAYRKQMQLTQAELAEKINYSDKSISKWERGEGVPDIAILKQLADFYGITVNDFLIESGNIKTIKRKSSVAKKRITILLLSIGLAWLVSILLFTSLNLFKNPLTNKAWMCFIYALPVSAIICTVFAGIWKWKIFSFFSISAIFWTVPLCLYLSIDVLHSWLLFLVPIALEILLILWFFLKTEIKDKILRPIKKKKAEQIKEIKETDND